MKGLPRGGPFLLVAALLAGGALATPDGKRNVTLHARDGSTVVIGQVTFTPQPDGSAHFALTMDHARFGDHFLSMREFKCLPGGTEILCHVPYPYAQPGTVRDGDLAWLEHALLFMFKKPSEFGAKLWNGVYWSLKPEGQGWVGTPQAVDLNLISAPPDKPGPPFRKPLRDDMPADARWFVRLTID
ncbi:hypothetical protein ENE75_19455 [Rubrivivax albus]|uniref:Uncharacterized protein n=2 Tax=Rubrivivax albus TaxID=2499835 RepID=A0A437JSR2_9BURK|nr:hypothetical protein ENE75_19455 [Rubrivivax albus]